MPEAIANKISAGEVIERPASIVKELVENALDAGSSAIEIDVKHGGKSLIRVMDDGSGMTAEDAQLSVLRHATSKIEKAEDLNGVRSFGFRGEALPSIAAVSRFTLQSRTSSSLSGTELVVEGGNLVKARECTAAQGTVAEVRDLFFNTPARRKFLRQDSTEFGHILDTVICLALANLSVHFILRSQDKEVLNLLPTNDLAVRARAIFGDDWADQMIPVHGDIPYAKISGLIGKPSLASGNRAGQFFFINRRWVKAYGLSHALQAGYHGFLMQHRFPAAVLFFDIDPHHVDVNVHPTKQQVRLSHEAMIKSLVEKTVSRGLTQAGDLAPLVSSFAKDIEKSGVPQSLPASLIKNTREESDSFLRTAECDTAIGELGACYGSIRIGKKVCITKILGQIHRTYILAETEEGYVLIDQHAAHERVMFEALMKGFSSRHPSSQRLLIEEILDLPVRQIEILKENLDFLNQLGFEAELFGERSLVVRAVPSILKDENPVTLLKEFADEKETGKMQTRLKSREGDVAALIACKRKSVKAADSLGFPAIEALLAQLGKCENPFNCPHGRPTMIRYHASDIEKQFKRKV